MSCDARQQRASAALLPHSDSGEDDEEVERTAAARYCQVAAILEAAARGEQLSQPAALELAPLVDAVDRKRLKLAAIVSFKLLCDVPGADRVPRAERMRPFFARANVVRRWLQTAPPKARAL